MHRISLMCITLLACSRLQAEPVIFSTASIFADAFTGFGLATAIDSNGLEFTSGDPNNDSSITASASSSGVAFADVSIAFAPGEISLTATSDTSSENGTLSDATASAELFGDFSGAGTYRFELDFDSFNERSNIGMEDFAGGSVAASIAIGSTEIFSASLIDSGQLAHEFFLDDNAVGLLSVFVLSDGSVGSIDSSAFNLAHANINFSIQPVPLPAAFFFFAPALLGPLLFRRAQKHR